METMRTYGDACGIPRALDRVGERWALMIVRELVLGPKRFTDLRAGLPNASPNVLSQRLRQLEQDGIVRRRKLPPPAGSRVYELTEWGLELEPVLTALGRWGARAPDPPPEHGMSLDAHILSLTTLFDPDLARGLLGQPRPAARRAPLPGRGGRRPARDHAGRGPGARRGRQDRRRHAAWRWHTAASSSARRWAPAYIEIDGDAEVVARFLGLFPLPEPALSGGPPAAAVPAPG